MEEFNSPAETENQIEVEVSHATKSSRSDGWTTPITVGMAMPLAE